PGLASGGRGRSRRKGSGERRGGAADGDPRQTPKIDRVKLHGSHVEKVVVEIVGDLGDDLRLTNSACTPDVQGHTFTDERMKRLIEFRWFHNMSSINLKYAGCRLTQLVTFRDAIRDIGS